MGKHKTQREKLEKLRTRLDNGETIKNWEIRAAFGKKDYKIYEESLQLARKENEGYKKASERTKMQKRAEVAVKQCYMFMERSASKDIVLEEAAMECFEELTKEELKHFNPSLYTFYPATDRFEMHFKMDTQGEGYPPIYVNLYVPQNMADIKKTVLMDAIHEKIGMEEVELTPAQNAELREKLEKLRAKRRP